MPYENWMKVNTIHGQLTENVWMFMNTSGIIPLHRLNQNEITIEMQLKCVDWSEVCILAIWLKVKDQFVCDMFEAANVCICARWNHVPMLCRICLLVWLSTSWHNGFPWQRIYSNFIAIIDIIELKSSEFTAFRSHRVT